MVNQKKFLKILCDILQNDKFENIICWTEDGTEIILKSPKDFEQQIMPEFFHSTKVTSFYRQLNQYGFKYRQNEQRDKVFCLKQFNRDNYNQLRLAAERKKGEIQENDNFYQQNKKLSNQLKLLQNNNNQYRPN